MPAQTKLFSGDRRNRPVWLSQKIDQTPISDLKPFAKNLRNHSEKSIGRLADAISEFGFVVPVVIDRQNTVITGHGRIEAAKRLKLSTIPTICVMF